MALYYSKGTISDMSEVQSGQSRSGNTWQRMTLTLEIPGFQGSVTKQVFQVFGEAVDDVLEFQVGDRVEVGFSLYAREWNGRLFNNVDLIKISSQEAERPAPAAPPTPKTQQIPFNQGDPQDDPEKDLPF